MGNFETKSQVPRLLVLDDDPLFGNMVSKTAKQWGIPLTFVCPNVEIENLPVDGHFDVIIIDYDLGELNGVELSALFRETPVLLASANINVAKNMSGWPFSIKDFADKRAGIPSMLAKALELTRLQL